MLLFLVKTRAHRILIMNIRTKSQGSICLKGILYLNYQLNPVPSFASLKYRIRLIKVLMKAVMTFNQMDLKLKTI